MSAPDMKWLRGSYVAHRGLHEPARGILENSMSAFEAAIAGGYAIECDVRLSEDAEPVVFHDDTLDRLTGETGPVDARSAEALSGIALTGTSDTIPHLRDLLSLTAGRVPLLIELKTYDGSAPIGILEEKVAALLADYDGPAAIQGFHPGTVQWFARHAPHVPRGFLSEDYRVSDEIPLSAWQRFAMRTLIAAIPARPHFIGYDVNAIHHWPVAMARRFGLPALAWTVRSQEQADAALAHCDTIIFEGFIPRAETV